MCYTFNGVKETTRITSETGDRMKRTENDREHILDIITTWHRIEVIEISSYFVILQVSHVCIRKYVFFIRCFFNTKPTKSSFFKLLLYYISRSEI